MKLSALVFFALLGLASSLVWQTWTGAIPEDAVSIENAYFYQHASTRTDYVCKHLCNVGYYTPKDGPYCFIAYANSVKKLVKRYTQFKILVNMNNTENLMWKEGTNGLVPTGSLHVCPNQDIYVGRTWYGLGQVDQLFTYPILHRWYTLAKYEVLAVNMHVVRDVVKKEIYDVKYITDEVKISELPPETMRSSTVINNGCQTVSKTMTLDKTTWDEITWTLGVSHTAGVSASITVRLPFLVGKRVEFKLETTLLYNTGATTKEVQKHSVSVQIWVPPNHSCTVRMEGRQFTAVLPYTSQFIQSYRDGKTKSDLLTGTCNLKTMGDIHAVIDRCEPVANATLCPSV